MHHAGVYKTSYEKSFQQHEAMVALEMPRGYVSHPVMTQASVQKLLPSMNHSLRSDLELTELKISVNFSTPSRQIRCVTAEAILQDAEIHFK